MHKVLFLLFSFTSLQSFAQGKDTVFTIRGYSCECTLRDVYTEGKIFDRVQQSPAYPGGQKAWKRFLKNNPPDSEGEKKEKFTIQMVVSPEGTLSDFARKSPVSDNKLAEAKRLLLLSGPWFPAVQNGYCVMAYHRLEFNF